MKLYSLYSQEVWERFIKNKVNLYGEFQIKKYPQLDPYFDFSKNQAKIQDLISDETLEKISKHSFLPFVKILVKTPRFRYEESNFQLQTKIRPISFASHFDSYLYSFYSFALNEKYQAYIRENGYSECVLAYRNDLDGKCNIQFAKEAFNKVSETVSKNKNAVAIALDISGYFDSIDHSILKEKWCKIIGLPELPADQFKIFKSITSYSYINKNSILKHFEININKEKRGWQSLLDLIPDKISGSKFKQKMKLLRERKLIVKNKPKSTNGVIRQQGIPQGSPISALLSNLYLIDFDEWLFTLSKEIGFTYRRYCDDILLICKEEDWQSVSKFVIQKIEEYKLTIQSKKAEIIFFKHCENGKIRSFNLKKINEDSMILLAKNQNKYFKNLQYLGFEFNGENIYLRHSSLSRYFRKAKSRISKTIKMAYSDKSKIPIILKKQIYERYTHFGKRNFLTYARNAASESYVNSSGIKREGLNSLSIKRQLSAHFGLIEREILNNNQQIFNLKKYKNDLKKAKKKSVKKITLKK